MSAGVQPTDRYSDEQTIDRGRRRVKQGSLLHCLLDPSTDISERASFLGTLAGFGHQSRQMFGGREAVSW